MIGQTLSHYPITAALGAGGMGDRLGRFKRESHLLAAIDDPNIPAIYGLEGPS